jgi:hypothetical protein
MHRGEIEMRRRWIEIVVDSFEAMCAILKDFCVVRSASSSKERCSSLFLVGVRLLVSMQVRGEGREMRFGEGCTNRWYSIPAEFLNHLFCFANFQP